MRKLKCPYLVCRLLSQCSSSSLPLHYCAVLIMFTVGVGKIIIVIISDKIWWLLYKYPLTFNPLCPLSQNWSSSKVDQIIWNIFFNSKMWFFVHFCFLLNHAFKPGRPPVVLTFPLTFIFFSPRLTQWGRVLWACGTQGKKTQFWKKPYDLEKKKKDTVGKSRPPPSLTILLTFIFFFPRLDQFSWKQ